MKKKKVNGILLLYHYPLHRKDAFTINEHIFSFGQNSKFDVWELNTALGFDSHLKELEFDIIILHYSLFGAGSYYDISDDFCNYIKEVSSYKIAFFQDEYRYCQRRFKFINENNISTIYTCLEKKYHHLVYGKYTNAKHIIHNLTGYVSEDLLGISKKFSLPYEERKIDIGYRARRLEFYMGKGGQEKHLIGEKFLQIAEEKKINLSLDIDVEEKNRLYGEEWHKFVGNCKSMLGVESGVSVFDVEDEVTKEYEIMIKEKPNMEFDEFYNKILYKYEDKIPLRTVSPRNFEAIAFGTIQILFEGNYADMLKADLHYIPLKKDFSNFDEVINKLEDKNYTNKIIDTAFKDIIESGNYTYKKFIEEFDNHLYLLGFTAYKNTDYKKTRHILDKNVFIRKILKLTSYYFSRIKLRIYRYIK
ncbi:MAG: hypothetical protein AABZ74_15750 [Cyanobacteriota bacterium]